MDTPTKQLEFAITRILDCGFLVEEAIIEEPTVDMGHGMNFVYNADESWVQMGIRTDFKQGKSGVLFLSGTTLTRFAIKDLKSFEDENGIVTFPPNSLETLFSIAFGHMRAMLAKNSAGTRFNTFIVPVINPTELFQELYKGNVETATHMYTTLGLDVEGKKAIELFDSNLTRKVRGQNNSDDSQEPVQIEDKESRKKVDDLYDELPSKATEEAIAKLKKKHAK